MQKSPLLVARDAILGKSESPDTALEPGETRFAVELSFPIADKVGRPPRSFVTKVVYAPKKKHLVMGTALREPCFAPPPKSNKFFQALDARVAPFLDEPVGGGGRLLSFPTEADPTLHVAGHRAIFNCAEADEEMLFQAFHSVFFRTMVGLLLIHPIVAHLAVGRVPDVGEQMRLLTIESGLQQMVVPNEKETIARH